jgi:putative ABC transport system permease protein
VKQHSDSDDFKKEIRTHLDIEAEEQQSAGVPEREARYRAQRAFGNATTVSEDVRRVSHWRGLEEFRQDIRFGARMLWKNPGFTIVAVLTLALGIGANTAIFSVIEGVMLRGLPFHAPEQLVRIYSTKNGVPIGGYGNPGGPSAMDLRDFAQSNHTFQQIVAYDHWRKNVSFGDRQVEPEQMRVGLVPAAYFQILEIQPIMGRLFTDEETQAGRNFVAAISARLWKERFDADNGILGQTIRINDEAYTIVAVMPDVIPEWMEGQSGGDASPVQVWTPFITSNLGTEAARGARGDSALGRMKPGVTLEQAQADLSIVAGRLAASYAIDQEIGVRIEKLSETRVRNLRSMLYLLIGAVSLILLIACVNLANLLLARQSVRSRELALRGALGALRGRLVRQLLAETLLLSFAGGVRGLILARLGVDTLKRVQPPNMQQLASIGVNWKVLLFTIGVSLATSVLFGLGPAILGTRFSPVEVLKAGSRSGTAGSGAQRLRGALVVAEMAMSLMLLVVASLLIQSIVRLEKQQLGIRQEHVLKGHFYMPPMRYPNPESITRFCDRFGEGVRQLPGVIEASVTTLYPPDNGWTQMLGLPGRPATRVQDIPSAQFGVADAHFLKTLGIPLMRGRDFAESDNERTATVALINQEFERRYFSTQDPIGQRVHIGPPAFLQVPAGGNTTDSSDVTIIGVTGDFKNNGLASPPEPQIIGIYSQHPQVNYGFKDIVIRTSADPHLLVREVSRQLHAMDPDMPFAQVKTIDEIIEQNTGGQRFTALLLALFAAAAILLAAVGIYGVISFLVAQRKRELAIRAAVGASAGNILRLVLGTGMRMTAVGALFGLLATFAVQKLISGILFGISPFDPLTFAGAALFLLGVAFIACWVPAWRSARVDPNIALRAD